MIGTTFTATDLMQIVDAAEEDGLLRYWGISYGATLVATVAAMFPERIDRIVLDSFMNPHQYYNRYDIALWPDTDKTFSRFIKECLRVPNHCVFAHRDRPAEDIETAVYQVLADLKVEPLVEGITVIDSYLVSQSIRDLLSEAGSYVALPRILSALLDSSPDTVTLSALAFSLGTGDFDVRTKHPPLIIGNTYNLATPLASARNLSGSLEGSILVEHGGFEHGSLKHGSTCTAELIREYFSSGALPEPNTYCETDYSPFGNTTFAQFLTNIGFMDVVLEAH
ncbi:uncharacterized protein BDV14DRAFT_194830 [Aspergillus stella-maris]|uniref:uncharacterized protein n=1 Tax=Aspergillus stella-maris TaxID=1810926 RepID=UPI003CCDFD43